MDKNIAFYRLSPHDFILCSLVLASFPANLGSSSATLHFPLSHYIAAFECDAPNEHNEYKTLNQDEKSPITAPILGVYSFIQTIFQGIL